MIINRPQEKNLCSDSFDSLSDLISLSTSIQNTSKGPVKWSFQGILMTFPP